jgi:hypothetical protein
LQVLKINHQPLKRCVLSHSIDNLKIVRRAGVIFFSVKTENFGKGQWALVRSQGIIIGLSIKPLGALTWSSLNAARLEPILVWSKD